MQQPPPLPDLQVVPLKPYLLLTLADIGAAGKAWPFILDALNRAELGLGAFEYAAACRAAATLGPEARTAVPGLMRSAP